MQNKNCKTEQSILFVQPNQEGTISYTMDEGLQFGLGFFATILIKDKPCFLEEHLQRLNKSLAFFGLNRYVSNEVVEDLIQKHSLKNIALKLIVTEKNQLAMVRPNPYDVDCYQRGKRLCISRVIRSHCSQIVCHKSLNYGENILEMHLANKHAYDDCLFFNDLGHVTESAIANLFIVADEQLLTPPLSDGLLPGIIRQKVIEHFQVKECHISLEKLKSCQGAFLTNSLMGAMPISHIEDIKIPKHPLVNDVIHFFK